MSHPEIRCPPSLALDILPLFAKDASPVVVPLISARYLLGSNGETDISAQLTPLKVGGEYWGPPEISSLKYEPQIAFMKPATDIVLIGHAYSFGKVDVNVSIKVGRLSQIARVVGDRYWTRVLGTVMASSPEPFERIPLLYERSFGGWDRSPPNPSLHRCEPRNPVGTGFRLKDGRFEEGVRLPNIEHSSRLLERYGDCPRPVGFGFVSPAWQPRVALAGTYDTDWQSNTMPCLPENFDIRFFNAASPPLISDGYLQGGEPVVIENTTPARSLAFRIPEVRPPICTIRTRGGGCHRLTTNLDTVIIDTDQMILMLMWRGYRPLIRGLHDIDFVEVNN